MMEGKPISADQNLNRWGKSRFFFLEVGEMQQKAAHLAQSCKWQLVISGPLPDFNQIAYILRSISATQSQIPHEMASLQAMMAWTFTIVCTNWPDCTMMQINKVQIVINDWIDEWLNIIRCVAGNK